jgi:membrane-associated phospholipid phosphatase
MRLRRSELFLCFFLVYAMTLALLRDLDPLHRRLLLLLNPALIAWCFLLAWADRFRQPSYLGMVRDWFMIPMILLAYREMGWMALEFKPGRFEHYWVQWDRWLLYDLELKAGIEIFGPVLPNLLELSYLLVYAVPAIAVGWFYWCGARERLDDFLSVLLFSTLTAYALYPWFPSDPPRVVFPGADEPLSNLLRRFNLAIVGNYGIHTSVFPSGHSAAAFGSAFGLLRYLPERPWIARRQMTLAVLIGIATVYGRYHYAIDTIAGLALALLAWGLSYLRLSWRTSRPS